MAIRSTVSSPMHGGSSRSLCKVTSLQVSTRVFVYNGRRTSPIFTLFSIKKTSVQTCNDVTLRSERLNPPCMGEATVALIAFCAHPSSLGATRNL